MKKILFLAIAGAFFVSSTAMAQVRNNNCDGSCLGNQRNFTTAQNNQMMQQERGTYRNNDNYRGNQARQMNQSTRYMNKGNCRHNNNYNNGRRGQGRMSSNW